MLQDPWKCQKDTMETTAQRSFGTHCSATPLTQARRSTIITYQWRAPAQLHMLVVEHLCRIYSRIRGKGLNETKRMAGPCLLAFGLMLAKASLDVIAPESQCPSSRCCLRGDRARPWGRRCWIGHLKWLELQPDPHCTANDASLRLTLQSQCRSMITCAHTLKRFHPVECNMDHQACQPTSTPSPDPGSRVMLSREPEVERCTRLLPVMGTACHWHTAS